MLGEGRIRRGLNSQHGFHILSQFCSFYYPNLLLLAGVLNPMGSTTASRRIIFSCWSSLLISFPVQTTEMGLQIREMMYHKVKLNKIFSRITGKPEHQVCNHKPNPLLLIVSIEKRYYYCYYLNGCSRLND